MPSAVGLPSTVEGLIDLTSDENILLETLQQFLLGNSNWRALLWEVLPYILELKLEWNDFWDWLQTAPFELSLGADLSTLRSLGEKLGASHVMEHIIHGLLTRRSLVTQEYTWNVYDSSLNKLEPK